MKVPREDLEKKYVTMSWQTKHEFWYLAGAY